MHAPRPRLVRAMQSQRDVRHRRSRGVDDAARERHGARHDDVADIARDARLQVVEPGRCESGRDQRQEPAHVVILGARRGSIVGELADLVLLPADVQSAILEGRLAEVSEREVRLGCSLDN